MIRLLLISNNTMSGLLLTPTQTLCPLCQVYFSPCSTPHIDSVPPVPGLLHGCGHVISSSCDFSFHCDSSVVALCENKAGGDIFSQSWYIHHCEKVKVTYTAWHLVQRALKGLYTSLLFIPTPTRLLWEEFSHAAITT